MKAVFAGLVTFVLVLAGLVLFADLGQSRLPTAVAIAAMLGVAVAVTFLCGLEPMSAPRAIDWYWFGAFALAWGLGTLGLMALDGIPDRTRLAAEALLLAASVMGYSVGHLAGLRRARAARPAAGRAPAPGLDEPTAP